MHADRLQKRMNVEAGWMITEFMHNHKAEQAAAGQRLGEQQDNKARSTHLAFSFFCVCACVCVCENLLSLSFFGKCILCCRTQASHCKEKKRRVEKRKREEWRRRRRREKRKRREERERERERVCVCVKRERESKCVSVRVCIRACPCVKNSSLYQLSSPLQPWRAHCRKQAKCFTKRQTTSQL